DVELKLVSLPGAHGWGTAWAAVGHPGAERGRGPSAPRLFTAWMSPPQRHGVRATTIHDLVPLHHPQWTTKRTQAMHGRKYRHAALTCDVLFANSEYTAGDVVRTLNVDHDRVVVAHPGIGEPYTANGPAEDL